MEKYRILIATNKFAARCTIINSLTSLNVDCYYVKSGKEGLNIISNVSFNLIIIDSYIPEIDGVSFCRALKENKITHGIPGLLI